MEAALALVFRYAYSGRNVVSTQVTHGPGMIGLTFALSPGHDLTLGEMSAITSIPTWTPVTNHRGAGTWYTAMEDGCPRGMAIYHLGLQRTVFGDPGLLR